MEIKSILTITELLFIFTYFSGCASIPSLQERKNTLQTIIDVKQYESETISTTAFNLLAIKEKNIDQCMNQPLNVYIEGDGLSWVNKSVVSQNPTPLNPMGLKLMSIDNTPCKVYLARPCQYITSNGCTKSYWTTHRFDTSVIQSYQEALDQLKQTYRNDSFTLIGYSGGAAVAILTAASRDDIKKIITIAGNVDTAKWVEIHHLAPLNGSLNPTDNVQRVENIDQIHLIGMNDTVVPKEVFLSYLSHFNDHSHVKYKLMDASHSENWEFIYKEFLHNHP